MPHEFVNQMQITVDKKRAQEILDKLLLEGLESGEPILVTAKYWQEKQLNLESFVAKRQNTDV